jgi:signal recognition particle subunit SRP54
MDDLASQLDSMGQLGSFDKLVDMIPGLGNVKDKISPEMMETQENKVKKWKAAISSMTKEEKENPELLEKQTSRMARIAKGSGTHTSEIRALIKQYKMLNELIKSQSSIAERGIDQKTMLKLAKKFGRKMKF